MKNIIVIAPHADDETLGCGGTLLRHQNEGHAIHWLLCSELPERQQQIAAVAKLYNFQSVERLKFKPTTIDQIPMSELVEKISAVFKKIQPNIIYLPFVGDIHTDHKVVFETTWSCTKWFRFPFIETIYAYETISETNFGLRAFRPNFYVNIEKYIKQKISIMNEYRNEMGEFPFPRSERAILALAELRGSEAGFRAAEAFHLLKQRYE